MWKGYLSHRWRAKAQAGLRICTVSPEPSLFIHIRAASWQNLQNDLCTQRRLRSAWAFAQSDQSSQCAQWVAEDPMFLHADSEDSDQTGQMPRLIGALAGRTGHTAGFVMRQHILYRPKGTFTQRSKDLAILRGHIRIWARAWQNQQNGIRAQRRFRSAWASAQSDQSLRCVL